MPSVISECAPADEGSPDLNRLRPALQIFFTEVTVALAKTRTMHGDKIQKRASCGMRANKFCDAVNYENESIWVEKPVKLENI